MDSEQTKVGVEHLLGVLARRAGWILLCVALVAGATFGFSKSHARQYTATASLVFTNNQLGQQVAGLPATSSSNQQAQQSTNVKLVQLGDMAERTARLLGRGGLTKEGVKATLSVNAEGESNIVNVAATASSPTLAADIANTYTKQFVTEQQDSNHAYYASALALVNKQLAALSVKERAGTAGLALQDRAQSLGVLAELRNGNVQVAEAATAPTSPSAPKVSRNTILGVILGLLLGVVVAFLLERFDRRIREPEDLETVYGRPLLGIVPESPALARSARRAEGVGMVPQSDTEAFHLIRAHLRYFNVDKELRTLLVASAAPGDGKTTVARHLASAAGRMGGRVLLVEADLRRPTIAQQLDLSSGAGLSGVLIGAVTMNDAIQSVALDGPSSGGSGGRTLDVLVAGVALPPNPGELIESHAMEVLLDRVKATYDLVVIDTPPLTVVSDAFPLLRKVDGVVIVGRVGRNRRDIAERLHHTLKGAGAPLLGVIANGFKVSRGSHGYSYDYSYTPEEQPAPILAPVVTSPNGTASPPPEERVPTAKN